MIHYTFISAPWTALRLGEVLLEKFQVVAVVG